MGSIAGFVFGAWVFSAKSGSDEFMIGGILGALFCGLFGALGGSLQASSEGK